MKKGFTLIEIMVVLVIIGIMSSVASSSSYFFKRKNDLKAVSTRGLNVIKLARSLAIIARTSVCVQATGNKFDYCDPANPPTITGDRGTLVKNKLEILMKDEFKLKNGNVNSDNNELKIKFNSQGIKDSSTAQYFQFSASDNDNETVAYYIIEISISGVTRFCSVSSSSVHKCN